MCLIRQEFEYDDALSVGTAFSGSDVVIRTLETFSAVCKEEYGVECEFSHVFSSESDKDKREFIMSQFDVGAVFKDFGHCSDQKAHDQVSGSMIMVPWPALLFTGFPCQNKSMLNRSRPVMTSW